MNNNLRIAIIGTGRRSSYIYAPIIRDMQGVELVAVWGRSAASAEQLGGQLSVPWYTNLEELVQKTKPDIGIVSVNYDANGEVGQMVAQHGLHLLLETPLAHNLDEASAIIQIASLKGLKVEVAEQYHLRPNEIVKRMLIEKGIFGNVTTAFNDFMGHAYHGISLLRSYLGFGLKPVQVIARSQSSALMPHWARLEGYYDMRTETMQHAIVEFEGGKTGIFHWTSVGYDSPLRWWQSTRFYGSKGMGISITSGNTLDEKLSILTPNGEFHTFITMERRLERIGPTNVLQSISAYVNGDVVRWENPFAKLPVGQNPGWNDDEIAVALCLKSLVDAIREGTEVNYGAHQALLDQQISLAIDESAKKNGLPVDFL